MPVHEDLLPMQQGGPARKRRDRSRPRRALIIALALLAVMAGLAAGGAIYAMNAYAPQTIEGAFDIPEESRPPKAGEPEADAPATGGGEAGGEASAAKGMTFLLAGTDRRSNGLTTGDQASAATWLPGAQRSDAIILAHLAGDGTSAYVASIPRDSWVDIPGYGPNKINAAFSFGGPSLYVQTIEQLTDTRIDHLAVIDWSGLIGLVDVLGGVTLTFDKTTIAGDRSWPAGTHTLTGEEVRAYVSERKRLPRGDFDRVERQQNVMRALAGQLIASGTLRDPAQALAVAKESRKVVSVDDTLTIPRMVDLALRGRALQPDNVTYVTAPTSGTGWEGDQSVVYLDQGLQGGFWEAFRTDTLDEWIIENGSRVTPERVN